MGYIGAGISRFNTADELTVSGDATIDTTTLVVDSTNNRVGVKVAPERDLHVKGASGDPVHFKLEGDPADYARIMFDDGTTDNIGELRYNFGSDYMSFNTNSAERMRLDSSGNLLVGTTSTDPRNFSSATYGIRLSDSQPEFGIGTMYINRSTGTDGDIISFRKDGSTVGSIFAYNGYLGIGGTGGNDAHIIMGYDVIAPATSTGAVKNGVIDLGDSGRRFNKGYFNDSVRTRYFVGVDDTNTYIEMGGSDVMKFVTGGSERGRFEGTGTFRLNTTANQVMGYELFTCNGAAGFRNGDASVVGVWQTQSSAFAMQFFSGAAGNNVGSISVTNNATAFNTSSDRRLKSNIQDAASASDKIDAIQIRQFDWNLDDSHQDYGLIAQELQPIEPLAVTGDADSDEMMAVDYSKLVPMLIKEIQELRSRVAALEAN